MPHTKNKPKTLNRKLMSSKSAKENSNKIDKVTTNMNLESFVTLSASSLEDSKDDSLFKLGSSLKENFSVNSEVDVFDFSIKSKTKPIANAEVDSTLCVNTPCMNEVLSEEQSKETNIVNESIDLDCSSGLFQNRVQIKSKNDKCKTNSEDEDVAVKSKTESIDSCKLLDESKEIKKQCPLCLKIISSEKYVTHMKSCAVKNNVDTQKLLEALKLHKKQLAERKELGLEISAPSFRAKGSPKRQKTKNKKGVVDEHLQLAIALSESLRSAEEQEVIEEAEALNTAGLSTEAQLKLSTLENFGFASDQPPPVIQGTSKSSALPTTLLLKRSKDERERMITEKIAIILIGEEENNTIHDLENKEPSIRSRKLQKEWNKDNQLWNRSHRSDVAEPTCFYVEDLLKYVQVSELQMKMSSNSVAQLVLDTCNTPDGANGIEAMPELTTPPECSMMTPESRCSTVSTCKNSSLDHSSLVNAWRTLVNNRDMSDVEVISKDGVKVPAHKLVFFVRCPQILKEIEKSEDGTMEQLNFREFGHNLLLAFLQFVYCARIENITSLPLNDLNELVDLAEKYKYSELINYLNALKRPNKITSINKVRTELFSKNEEIERLKLNNLMSVETCSLNDPSLELKLGNTSGTQASVCVYESISSRGQKSPDLFDDSHNNSVQIASQTDLDILASLVEKPVQTRTPGSQTKYYVVRDKTDKNSASKRKVSDCEFDDMKETSATKKLCSNESKIIPVGEISDVCDLTQSSNTSNEEDLSEHVIDDGEQKDTSDNNYDDCMENLTQKHFDLQSDITQTKHDSGGTSPKFKDESRFLDNINPIWDDFDDGYLHVNYSPLSSSKLPTETSGYSSNNKSECLKEGSKLYDNSLNPENIPNGLKNVNDESDSDNLKLGEHSSTKTTTLDKYEYVLSSDSDIDFVDDPNSPQLTQKSNQIKTNPSLSPENNKICKSFSQRDSLAKRLLNDSFEINDSILASADIIASDKVNDREMSLSHQSSTCNNHVMKRNTEGSSSATTPSAIVKVSDNVTPLPNYSAMKTPALKKELSRFGLKPSLGKRKAKLLLRYIYDETHPLVSDGSSAEHINSSPTNSPDKIVLHDSSSDTELTLSQKSGSSISSLENNSENFYGEEECITQEIPVDEDAASLKIRSCIVSDPDLHQKVLMYEPIYLEDILSTLKANRIKINKKTVMDYLDEQCITFRTKTWEQTNKRRKMKTGRSCNTKGKHSKFPTNLKDNVESGT